MGVVVSRFLNNSTLHNWELDLLYYTMYFTGVVLSTIFWAKGKMGSIMAKVMDDNMKKQQEFMMANNKIMVNIWVHIQHTKRILVKSFLYQYHDVTFKEAISHLIYNSVTIEQIVLLDREILILNIPGVFSFKIHTFAYSSPNGISPSRKIASCPSIAKQALFLIMIIQLSEQGKSLYTILSALYTTGI